MTVEDLFILMRILDFVGTKKKNGGAVNVARRQIYDLSFMGLTSKVFNIELTIILKSWVHIAIYCNNNEFLYINLCYVPKVLDSVEPDTDTMHPPLLVATPLATHMNVTFEN